MILLNDDPPWLRYAAADLGLAEIPGKATAPKIAQWLRQLGAWWDDDETPWCGVACAAWFTQASIAPPQEYYRAASWLNWGRPLSLPKRGCVAVMRRPGGYHVGLVVGTTRLQIGKLPDLVLLGGNQGNRVSVATMNGALFLGYRVPPGERTYAALPVIDADASTSQA